MELNLKHQDLKNYTKIYSKRSCQLKLFINDVLGEHDIVRFEYNKKLINNLEMYWLELN